MRYPCTEREGGGERERERETEGERGQVKARCVRIKFDGPRTRFRAPQWLVRGHGEGWYRDTSLIRNNPPVGPYSRPVPRAPVEAERGGEAMS